MIVVLGNPAGIAIALCAMAIWCFARQKFVGAGVLCMATALALKPHDVALVWLFLIVAGGTFRKAALQSLLAFVAITLPMVVWICHISPGWHHELGTNIAALSIPGGPADLSPAPLGSRGGGVYLNLQAAVAFFGSDPRIANLIAYAVFLALFVVWLIAAARRDSSQTTFWLGLSAAAPLSMLPVYHHLLDAKLLLLSVPACSLLLAKRHPLRWLAFWATAAGIFVTADLPWGVFLALTHGVHAEAAGSPTRFSKASVVGFMMRV